MNNKHWHCAIYKPDKTAGLIPISEEHKNIYEEDRDLTRGDDRATRPITEDGTPVFYIVDNTGELIFFGSTKFFRVPYQKSPYNLLPPEHRYVALYNVKRDQTVEFIDFAEAMFGFIREDDDFAYPDAAPVEKPKQGDKQRAYAGRVTVSDAVSNKEVSFYANGKEITPKILSSPKPTSFQKYLEQNTDNPRRMQHYDSTDATLRGHKLYWHQGGDPDFVEPKPDDKPNVHTKMKPIARGNRFQFRIHFNALSATELGALLWVLTPPGEQNKTYAHKIGMGKALGLGSVKLTPSLHLIDRDGGISEGGIGRYHRLFTQDKAGNVRWHEAKDDYTDLIHGVAADFEQYMLKKLKSDKQRLRDVERIADLLALMQWRGDLSPQDQQKIEDEGYEKGRRRLPTPREVFPN